MTTINLATLDRDTYVAFRAQWKAHYKELSATIRERKLDVKNAMRAESSLAGMHQNNLRYLQGEARDELEELKQAKARLKEITAQAVAEAA